MDKKKLIITIVSAVVVVAAIVAIITSNKNNKNEDAIKFAKEYSSVTEDNVFVYKTADEIIKIMKNGTGVVYLGFPECPWCNAYVKYLNEVAKKVGIEKIYYFNVLEDRKNNTDDYKEMVSLLGEYLQHDEEGNPRIFVPNVSFHVKGKIVGNDSETSLDTKGLDDPAEYWTEEEVKDLKEKLEDYSLTVYEALNTCTDCNK